MAVVYWRLWLPELNYWAEWMHVRHSWPWLNRQTEDYGVNAASRITAEGSKGARGAVGNAIDCQVCIDGKE